MTQPEIFVTYMIVRFSIRDLEKRVKGCWVGNRADFKKYRKAIKKLHYIDEIGGESVLNGLRYMEKILSKYVDVEEFNTRYM